jgi:8-oxo-dGTP pyrophosphatase MutT (NUDIX family)
VVREVHEETGLDAMIGDTAHVHSVRFHASNSGTDMHSVRIVYDGWVPRDAPEPHVVERDGSTVDVAWFPLADVTSGAVTVSGLVTEALAAHAPAARQRLAAYALVRRDDTVLLTRISATGAHPGVWTLPGGGVDHGENPRDALVREIREETGLDAEVGETARIYSAHLPSMWRKGRRWDYQALRIVYDAWVPADAPEPRVVEVDGSTVAVDWHPVADVLSGGLPVTDIVTESLSDHRPYQLQRVAVYALIRRGDEVLLTRISPLGAHPGVWTLPGGGLDHGETPRDALAREVREECGVDCQVGDLLDVHDIHFQGTAPSGRFEDFHGVHLVFRGVVPDGAEPRVVETDGTTDDVAWVHVADVASGRVPVLDVVRAALEADLD